MGHTFPQPGGKATAVRGQLDEGRSTSHRTRLYHDFVFNQQELSPKKNQLQKATPSHCSGVTISNNRTTQVSAKGTVPHAHRGGRHLDRRLESDKARRGAGRGQSHCACKNKKEKQAGAHVCLLVQSDSYVQKQTRSPTRGMLPGRGPAAAGAGDALCFLLHFLE